MMLKPPNRFILWATMQLSPQHRLRTIRRRRVARKYLHGRGLEIGALHFPLHLAATAAARYVDYRTTEQLRRDYSELAWVPLAPVSIVDDARTLGSIADSSQDFVIANHVIEHCEDPIRALENWLRVLRPGGVLFLAVPDMRRTFDHRRAITTVNHLQRDYDEGPAWSLEEHYREFGRLVRGLPEAAIDADVAESLLNGTNIHFHTWTPCSFTAMLDRCLSESILSFRLELLREHFRDVEFLVVLRKPLTATNDR